MDFEPSEEQAMLRDVSRATLRDHAGPERVRGLLGADEDVDTKLWQLGADLGWTGLALPEEYDGAGQGLTELALVAEELGRAVARGPFLTSALVGLAVSRGGSAELCVEVLPLLAAGSARATWAFAEAGGQWSTRHQLTTATPQRDGFVLRGTKSAAQDAGSARWLLVTAQLDGEPANFLVDRHASGVTVRRQRSLDLTRNLYEVSLDQVHVPFGRRLHAEPAEVSRLRDAGAVLTAADALGAAEWMLTATVEYAKVRVQFGRPIGSFQAIKHKAADMRLAVQGMRAAVYYAAMAADAGAPDASQAASTAKAFASEEASRLAGEALQIHGGIGFTWEHDLHLYLRRVKADEVLYGNSALHYERVCRLLLAARHPVFP
ncbi:acyl-CoA dehydrogenase family protein [Streptomyces fuscichromogenes]|uniref:Acyl-CoA dehydrogenase n=1 Tax=Streptomyces fuscichromogenes TaxID=1324013 RepID=A0A918CX93_9ACTN|nr:acyl-CoA dehydrogenase family protein [Streptomyces fuscichromogenes]GGN44194.1 acyl-CoA dehydrogenase [Streptomyces fuscichromogenes]